jgi:hypothetical protein
MRVVCSLLLGVVLAADAGAQMPPPGYPGRGAPSIPPPPIPRPRRKPGAEKKPKETKEPLLVYKGVLESRTAEKIVLDTGDGQHLDFTCTKDTLYFRKDQQVPPESVEPGARVVIEGRQNDESFLFAVNVIAQEEESAAARPVTPPEAARAGPPRDADDPGPPALRRGKPERVSRPEPQAAEPPPAPVPEETPEAEDPRIVKAREVARSFTETLPNYIVQQITTRYWNEKAKTDWRALDLLSAEVIYLNGKELYRDIRIDNKPVKQPLEELRGTVSHGEFGTTLADIFSPATDAHFTAMGTSNFSGRRAWKYDFRVEMPNSHWLTRFGSHSIRPAYHGTVWLDPATARVLRIEMQARDIPGDYPLDIIEWVVEYGQVRIGGNEYLLPVHAEVLGCLRGTSRCSRNSTDYRNYRRFTAESQIYTTDSTIDFGKEVPVPPQKP